MSRRSIAPISLLASTVLAMACAPAALAETEATTSTPIEATPPPVTTTTTVPAPTTPAPSETPSAPSVPTTPSAPSTTSTGEETTQTTPAPALPEVRSQSTQPRTSAHRHTSQGKQGEEGRQSKAAKHGSEEALPPSALTPPLPSTLTGEVAGVPSFFINSFSIPPFLLPIYQAAGAAYGIPWQILAAINEVETDYGRDLNISSAGAEGWMQFMPSTWDRYGVDVNDDGFEDPYNPADAIFGAARYLAAAGGDTNIKKAIFAYNHSRAYVNSVLLRARLLSGTPPELLGAITGLTEARFPVYAASHYSDSFPVTEGVSPHTVAGTTIYSQPDAPVVAVQDGRITSIDESGAFGRTVSLQDAYGNIYTYGGLGTLATLYPVLESAQGSEGQASTDGTPASEGSVRMFKAGSENVYLHSLKVGSHVIAGTVLGHLSSDVQPHLIFQIRPSGPNAPAIDPKPILDGWVKLQSSSATKAKGADPFATSAPSPGQALLESKTQLENQLETGEAVELPSCERGMLADGALDRRVLATLEFLAASGLEPTVSSQSCAKATTAVLRGPENTQQTDVYISAINGARLLEGEAPSALAARATRKLHHLQGVMKPLQIGGPDANSEEHGDAAQPGLIHVSFAPLGPVVPAAAGGAIKAHVSSGLFGDRGLSPIQWIKLIARLGQIPDPNVGSKPSSAAIPDTSSSTAAQPVGEGD